MGQDKIWNEKLQGKLLTAREEDQGLDRKARFAWLWEWSECPECHADSLLTDRGQTITAKKPE